MTTIVVTDDTAKGEKENTYKLTFKGVQPVLSLPEAAPSITYGDALRLDLVLYPIVTRLLVIHSLSTAY